MTSVQILYLVGAPAALANPIYYTITARWWKNREGRLFFGMLFLPFCLYAASIAFLLLPNGWMKEAIRFFFVFVASSVSWGILLNYRLIRKEGIAELKRKLLRINSEKAQGGESDDVGS